MALSDSVAAVLDANGFLPKSGLLTDAQVLTMQALAEEENNRQKEILMVRRYVQGKQDVFLTPRQKQWLEKSGPRTLTLHLNLTRKVIEAVAEKLIFDGVDGAKIVLDEKGFLKDITKQREVPKPPPPAPIPLPGPDGSPPPAPPAPAEPAQEEIPPDMVEAMRQLAWSGYLMSESNILTAWDEAREMAIRDGESFIFITPNKKDQRFPKWIAQQRYTDPSNFDGADDNMVSGDGEGCRMHYPHDDHRLDPEFCTKRWIEYEEGGITRQRENLYFPNRIEFWARDISSQQWVRYPDPENENKTSVELKADGKDFGIVIVHLKCPDLRPKVLDAIPLQDAINKALLDLLAAADSTAFQTIVTRGWFPTTDGNPPEEDESNLLEWAPGRITGTSAKANESATDVIPAADLTPLIELLRVLVIYLAVVCNLPASRYNFSGNVAAEQTLKEQDEPLLSEVRRLQQPFGDALEEAFVISRRMANLYGKMKMDEEVAFHAMWGKGETRSTMDLLQELAIKREKINLPLRQLWIEAGYTEAQVDKFMKEPEIKAFMDKLSQSVNDALNQQITLADRTAGLQGNNLKNKPQVPGGKPGQGRAAASDQTVNNLRNRGGFRNQRRA